MVIGDGCEGYSPSLATTAKTEITATKDFIGRPRFFLQFNAIYEKNPIMSLWKLINFEALSEKDAEAMVEQLPELEEMLLSVIDENVQEI